MTILKHPSLFNQSTGTSNPNLDPPVAVRPPRIETLGFPGDAIVISDPGEWLNATSYLTAVEIFDTETALWVLFPEVTDESMVVPTGYGGRQIRLRKTASGPGGADTQFSDPVELYIGAPNITADGTISGALTTGSTLTFSGTTWTGEQGVLATQWALNGAPVGAENAASITLRAADVGKTPSVLVRVASPGGYDDAVVVAGAAVAWAAPVKLGNLPAASFEAYALSTALDFASRVEVPGDPTLSSITWTLQSGTVPAGLSRVGGTIPAGIPTTVAAASTVILRGTNPAGNVDISCAIAITAESTNSDAAAFLARATGMATKYQTAVNRFWKDLLNKTGKTAANYDYLHVVLDTKAHSYLNMVSASHPLVEVGSAAGSMVFTPDVGTTGLANAGLSPGVTPGALTHCVEGSAFTAFWLEAEEAPVAGVPSTKGVVSWTGAAGGGSQRIAIAPIGDTSFHMAGRLYGGTALTSAGTVASRKGFTAATRTGTGGTSQFAMYHAEPTDTTVAQTDLRSSVSMPPADQLTNINYLNGGGVNPAFDTISMTVAGDYHTPAQVQGFFEAFQAFRAALGLGGVAIANAGVLTGPLAAGRYAEPTGTSFSGASAVATYEWQVNTIAAPTVFNPIPSATGAGIAPGTGLYAAVGEGRLKIRRKITVENPTSTATAYSNEVEVARAEVKVVFDPEPRSTDTQVTITSGNIVSMTANGARGARANRWWSRADLPFAFQIIVPGGNVANAAAYVGVAMYQSPTLRTNTSPTDNTVDYLTACTLSGTVFGATPDKGTGKVAPVTRSGGGDRVWCCVDPALGRIWFGSASKGWNGDPVAKTGGFAYPTHGLVTLHISPQSATGAQFTLVSLAADFVGAIPAGYVPYAEIRALATNNVPIKGDTLAEKFGTNVHFDWANGSWDSEGWKAHFKQLGCRNFRTGVDRTAGSSKFDVFEEMIADIGARFVARVAFEFNTSTQRPNYNPSDIEDCIDATRNRLPISSILAWEGPNEPAGGGPIGDWAQETAVAQKTVWDKVQTLTGGWQNKPVLGIAHFVRSLLSMQMVNAKALLLAGGENGTASFANATNIHNYHDGYSPVQNSIQETKLGSSGLTQVFMDRMIESMRAEVPGAPWWVTEYGQRTWDASTVDPTPQNGDDTAELTAPQRGRPDPNVAANYIIRGYLEYLSRSGFAYAFHYNYFDDNTNTGEPFGLVAKTPGRPGNPAKNFVRRDAYYSVQRLLKLFDERGAAPGFAVPVYTPTNLRYFLTGNLSEVGHLWFQMANGRYRLVVWQDGKNWDRVGLSEVPVASRAVTLTLARQILGATQYRPTHNPAGSSTAATTTAEAVTIAGNGREIALSLSNEPHVIDLDMAA